MASSGKTLSMRVVTSRVVLGPACKNGRKSGSPRTFAWRLTGKSSFRLIIALRSAKVRLYARGE
jgi:hypothetical protein